MYIYQLGSNPELSIAEMKSLGLNITKLYRAQNHPISLAFCGSSYNIDKLGGTTKIFRLIDHGTDSYLEAISQITGINSKPRLTIGVNIIDKDKSNSINLKQLKSSIEKACRKKIRLINSDRSLRLSSASSVNNGTYKQNSSYEFIMIRNDSGSWCVGALEQVQNLKLYSKRDRNRPHRDALVGMLPPKLAQIIVNIAGGQHSGGRLLDPFCGTGVLLQEALLLGYDVIGSDIDSRMIDYSRLNIEWLEQEYLKRAQTPSSELLIADATTGRWETPFHVVATESYLGPPISSTVSQAQAEAISTSLLGLQKKTLDNLISQIHHGGRMCIAVPIWYCLDNKIVESKIIDLLGQREYNPMISFDHTQNLVYQRKGQSVGRRLLVINKR